MIKMNKVIVPVILVAVVAVAAGFAFSPVEQVSTVDDDIEQQHADDACAIRNFDSADIFNFTSELCDSDE